MHVKELPGITLEELASQVDIRLESWGGPVSEIRPHVDEDEPFLEMGQGGPQVGLEDPGAAAALAHYVGIPVAFYERITPDAKQFILDHQIQHAEDENVRVSYRDGTIVEVQPADRQRIAPSQLVEVAIHAIDPTAPVVDWWSDLVDFRLDVSVPEGFDRGVGGDRQVGDITRGGLRIGQDRRKNLAPTVQPYLYRLACTNGMEVPDASLKVSAKGRTVDEVLILLEGEARRAMGRVEADIQAYYDLRTHALPADPAVYLRRIAKDMGFPDRSVAHLEAMLPTLEPANGEFLTEWDIVNLLTNEANAPDLAHSRGPRSHLQRAGGSLVRDHARRCSSCHHRID
jgi:hypothetical protein